MRKIEGMANESAQVEWRKWMEANLYTQQDLALSLGITIKTVNNIVCGRNIPQARIQRKFVEFRRKIERNRRVRESRIW